MNYLDEQGLAENTVVIYTGDQGFFLGEHGWFDKRLMYEECLRMPFVIRYPKEIKPSTDNKNITLNMISLLYFWIMPEWTSLAKCREKSFARI